MQGRLFSYPDTHRHRLGANYQQIPINCPMSTVKNYQRDGPMCVNKNQGIIYMTPGILRCTQYHNTWHTHHTLTIHHYMHDITHIL